MLESCSLFFVTLKSTKTINMVYPINRIELRTFANGVFGKRTGSDLALYLYREFLKEQYE